MESFSKTFARQGKTNLLCFTSNRQISRDRSRDRCKDGLYCVGGKDKHSSCHETAIYQKQASFKVTFVETAITN